MSLSYEDIRPNRDIIEMTKAIIEQNSRILATNEKLLSFFCSPVFIENPKVPHVWGKRTKLV